MLSLDRTYINAQSKIRIQIRMIIVFRCTQIAQAIGRSYLEVAGDLIGGRDLKRQEAPRGGHSNASVTVGGRQAGAGAGAETKGTSGRRT